MAASPIFVSSFLSAYAVEILIEINAKQIAIRKNPKDSGISEPGLFPKSNFLSAIDPYTHLQLRCLIGQYLPLHLLYSQVKSRETLGS